MNDLYHLVICPICEYGYSTRIFNTCPWCAEKISKSDPRDAEIARLRAAIERAPHFVTCASLVRLLSRTHTVGDLVPQWEPVPVKPCDCWKREALEGGK